MPIKPENKKLYPKNWNDISYVVRFLIAHGKCQGCGVNHHAIGQRDEEGKFIPICGNIHLDLAGEGKYLNFETLSYLDARFMANNLSQLEEKYIVIVLTTAHMDHNPRNCKLSNLKALCQKCHNNYDKHHRAMNRRSKYGQLILNF